MMMMIKQKQRQASLGLGKKSSLIVKNSVKQTQQLIVKQAQIRKKLSKISSLDELQKIYNVIKKQNSQLVKDVGILKQHLAMVEENKKIVQQQKINSTMRKDKLRQSSTLLSSSRLSSTILLTEQQRAKYPQQKIAEWDNLRKQLHQQYKLMNLLKNNITNIKSEFPTEQIAEHQLMRKSIINKLTKDIQIQKDKKLMLQRQHKNLSQAIAVEISATSQNEQQISQLQRQNKLLRKQLLTEKQQTYQHQTKAAKVIDGIYQKKKQLLTQYAGEKLLSARQERQDVQQSGIKFTTKRRSNSVKSIHEKNKPLNNVHNNNNNKPSPLTAISSYNIVDNTQTPTQHPFTISQTAADHLSTQITTLKNQVSQISLASIKAKQTLKKQKQTLKLNNNKLNQNFISLQKNKTKKINQLNHLKAKLKTILNQIQLKQLQKVKMINSQFQTQVFDLFQHKNQPSLLLRRDFAGIIGPKNRFDDRIFLKSNQRTFIKGLIIYQNDSNLSIKGSLAAIRAIYTDQIANEMNFIPLPGSYIQKCKTIKFELPQDDFVKLMKVKCNTKQNRITKIEIRSNRNLKYEFGDKKPFQEINQFETVYAFDIGLNEFPVALFGSYCMKVLGLRQIRCREDSSRVCGIIMFKKKDELKSKVNMFFD